MELAHQARVGKCLVNLGAERKQTPGYKKGMGQRYYYQLPGNFHEVAETGKSDTDIEDEPEEGETQGV